MEVLKKLSDCCSTDLGIYFSLSHIFPRHSLSDNLFPAFSSIVKNPLFTLLVIILLDVLLVLLVFPFYVLSYVFTVLGAWAVFFLCFVWLCRFIARCMIFPGALLPVQKNISQEIMKTIAMEIMEVGKSIQEAATSLHITSKNGQQASSFQFQKKFISDEIEKLCDVDIPRFIDLLQPGGCTEEERAHYQSLSLDDQQLMETLHASLVQVENSFHALLALFYVDNSNLESSNPDDTKFKLLVRVDPKSGKRVGQRIDLQSLIMSDLRGVLLKRSAVVAHASNNLRKLAAHMGATWNNTTSGQGGASGYLDEINKGIKDFYQGCQGLEKMAFPLMRRKLELLYGLHDEESASQSSRIADSDAPVKLKSFQSSFKTAVERFSLTSDGNWVTNCTDTASTVIDGILVRGRADANIEQFCPQVNNADKKYPLILPVVLYCPPNAGFYECVGLLPLEASWVGVYSQLLGLDVCVFNYRGYANSTGTPNPTAIKSDGVEVARYLKSKYPNRGIIVHGESIGGMVACHVANQLGSDLRGLVCDKTFSGLDAVSRRMLGNWAGTSLSLLGRWDTDSLKNYCDIRDDGTGPFKVIMQDPEDEIIHHSSSMKVGVASHILMGEDSHTAKPFLDSEYAIADALGFPVPSASNVTGIHLNEEALSSVLGGGGEGASSAYCSQSSMWVYRLDLLLQHPQLPLSVFSEHQLPSQTFDGHIAEAHTKSIMSNVKNHMSMDFVQHFSACVVSLSRRAVVAVRNKVKSPKGVTSSMGFGIKVPPSNHAQSEDVDDEEISSGSGETSDGTMSTGDTHEHSLDCQCGNTKDSSAKSKFSQLETFCSQSIEDREKLSWEERVWIAISRAEGGSGVLLGSCVQGGIDKIKAWILSTVMWGNDKSTINLASTTLPKSRSSLPKVSMDLKCLLEEKQCIKGYYNKNFSGDDIETETTGLTAIQSDFENIDDTLLFTLRAVQALYAKQCAIAQERTSNGNNIGSLLTVHNGHNGWLGQHALLQLLSHIATKVLRSENSADAVDTNRCARSRSDNDDAY